jgi:hypothetical protein
MAYPIRPKNLKKIGIDDDNVAALRDLQRKVTALTEGQPNQAGVGSLTWSDALGTFTITKPGGTVVPVGTVTSVAASGGTTGLTFSGSPIIGSGTLTLGGTLDLDNGGTGATTAAGARTALGLGTAATTDASAYATAAQGAKADTAVQTILSADGSVTITGTTAIDLSVAVAGSTSNVLLPVRNTTGATLTKGTAVYISGATGQRSTVSKAIATSDATSAQTLGLVTANISNNSNGNVTLIGTIIDIDTSAYTDGQQLYLSPTTAGTLTATKPYAPDHLVYMAVVEYAHPVHGKLFVKVQNGYEMDELHNVSAQSPANNDGIFYNTSTNLWEKKSIVTALGYTPYNATNPAGYTTNTGTVTSINLTAGTGIAVSGGPITSSGSITVTNTAPDQVVSLAGAGTTAVTGTYPSFTITSNDQYVGTVTSVSGTGTVNGITLTGTVTSSGSLTLGGTLGGIANSQLTNSSITINGSAISLGGSVSVGTVTSVSGTGTVNGITLTGSVTSTGNLTLGGTLSNVSLTAQVTGTLPVGNGGTGTATAFTTGSIIFAGASGVYSQDNANFNWDDTNNTLGVGRTASSNVRVYSRGGTTGSGAFSYYGENSAGTGCFGIRDDGAFFSGAASLSPYNLTTAAAANLVVAADFYLYRSTSSARYKKNIVDYDRGLDAIMSLRPVYYEGRGEIDEGKRFAGFVAEEVYDAGLTEFVVLDEEGKPDALHYGNMNALLVSALQEALYHITILIKRVNELEKKQ